MKFSALVLCLGFLQGILCFDNTVSPGCVSKCWDNSRYVSVCVKETTCLCKDAHFQSVVLQCLYSQCQTTQFGAALHHTLATCSEPGLDTLDVLPPLIRGQGLRKRNGLKTGQRYGSVSASATQSSARHSVSASAYTNSRPTRSVGQFPTYTHNILATSSANAGASGANSALNDTVIPIKQT